MRLTSLEWFPTQRGGGTKGGRERGQRKEEEGFQRWKKSPSSINPLYP